jgi:hypothetical protein
MGMNRTKFRRWTLTVLVAVISLVVVVVSINVTVDAYGILRTDFSRQFQVPNMNYVKMRFLIGNRKKFDSYIFGSSRSEKIDPKKITNGIYYDMTYPLGLPEEHLENIRFLLKNGYHIKNLMIGLDDFSHRADPQEHRNNLDLQLHPAVSGKKFENFYGEYFFKLSRMFGQLKSYISYNYTRRNDPDESRYIYDMFDSGRLLCPDCDEKIEHNIEKHVNSPEFLKPLIQVRGNNVANVLANIRELTDIAKKRDIRLTVFINPSHKTSYLDTDLRLFAEFKKELAGITDYYDFSGLNSITTNNYYYYETSHYRPMVGDMMLKVMFGAPDVKVPREFGVRVTRSNIDRHLRDQCREIQLIRKDLTTANASFAESCAAMPATGNETVLMTSGSL